MKRHTKFCLLVIILLLTIQIWLSEILAWGDHLYQHIKIFAQVIDIVNRSYVDQVDGNELLNAAIEGMLSHLDPHSTLLIGKKYQHWTHELTGYSVNDVQFEFLSTERIGYIKINLFLSTTGEKLKQALWDLKDQGMEKLILDLRGNSGGYFSAAVAVADQFLPDGKTIVTTKGRSPESTQEYLSTTKENFKLFPMIVMIDTCTASAAEIVAGALQDWDRALIIGQTSFGKGLMQSQYQLADTIALLLTTARYYTPSGRSIQRDYAPNKKNNQDQKTRPVNSSSSNHAITSRSCFHSAAGRLVYGGGGIEPDIFLPFTGQSSDSLNEKNCPIAGFELKTPKLNESGDQPGPRNDRPIQQAINYFFEAEQLLLMTKLVNN